MNEYPETERVEELKNYRLLLKDSGVEELLMSWVEGLKDVFVVADNMNVDIDAVHEKIAAELKNKLKSNTYASNKVTQAFVSGLGTTLRFLLGSVYKSDPATNQIARYMLQEDIEGALDYVQLDKFDEGYDAFLDELPRVVETVDKIVSDIISKNKQAVASPDGMLKLFADKRNKREGELGYYAFPTQRRSIGRNIEADTELEQSVVYDLESHFRSAKPLEYKTVKFIRDCLAAGDYNDIFKGPLQEDIYRGMQLDKKHAMMFLMSTGMKPRDASAKIEEMLAEDVMIGDGGIDFNANMKYTHREGTYASSWTTDYQFAIKIANEKHAGAPSKNTWGIVLHARASSNAGKFVSCEDGLYDLYMASQFVDEAEVLALDDINVHTVTLGLMSKAEYDWSTDV